MPYPRKKKILFSLAVAALYWVVSVDLVFATSEFKEIKRLTQSEVAKADEQVSRPKFDYDAEGYRNPFKNLLLKAEEEMAEIFVSDQGPEPRKAEKIATPPNVLIQGVVWGAEFPQAIINNKVVREGDTVEGMIVQKITKEGITFENKGIEHMVPSPAGGGKGACP